MREREIEDYLVKRVEEIGGEVRKVKWIGRRGAPDRFVLLPERQGVRLGAPRRLPPDGFWVELKAPGKKPTAQQQREHERLEAFGVHIEVIDSLEQVDEVLS